MPKTNGQIKKASGRATGRGKSLPNTGRRTTAQVRAPGMPDVQSSEDLRNVAIDRVGVKDVVYPIRLRERDGGEQSTVATVNMYVALPHHQKGTHMSRFLEVLNEQTKGPIRPDTIVKVAREICDKLHAEEAHFEATFPYFIRKPAPVTGMVGLMDYKVTFECRANHADDFLLTVSAPATSLCPCSKEISKYGAHNQRCRIEAKVRFKGTLWIEDLVELLEKAASSPVFAVLKRPDEKYVTEKAFENPKFVEDIVRDLALGLNTDDRITWYSINSENFESIHNHNAYAQITRKK
ncbi:MAG TPA: GTP cyclohydrolase FolE2 [Phycisphaerales bacterium]|nr:GTP cyclohydrolase FolE2 [Phycisphaerales bacterium]